MEGTGLGGGGDKVGESDTCPKGFIRSKDSTGGGSSHKMSQAGKLALAPRCEVGLEV